ncbi:glyoxal oxidase [Phaeosphaeria sp. MPI-PUGE-AT-0046c]|nr:glyoxal oxidase [Phaeosphaeria sp. MPI-PUGE-AT-0046c]
MKISAFTSFTFTRLALANIKLTWVNPVCDANNLNTCLAGQYCSADSICVPDIKSDHSKLSSTSVQIDTQKRQAEYSQDGRCGPTNDNLLCNPSSKVYSGHCCSQYGKCGADEDHCGTGCVSGCDAAPALIIANMVAATPTRDATTLGELVSDVLGSIGTILNPPIGAWTTNGSCGATFGYTVCGNWAQGSCCSMYGFCGNSTAHCGEGCQSGPCLSAPSVPAPNASPAPAAVKPGSIAIQGRSGVPAMHAVLMPNGKVVFLDKVENYTELKLANGQYAYSSEYDPETHQLTPLAYKTNAFHSGGTFLADGSFVSLGGADASSEFFDPTLSTARCRLSVQIMPNNVIFVASGSLADQDPTKLENNNPTYEILNADGTPQGVSTKMGILERNQPYYMSPFLHLMRDGNLFVQVSKSAEIFDVGTGSVVRSLPDLPGTYRTYPNTGGSVMMPLSSANNWDPDIIICGGGPYQDITAPGDPSCGRIKPLGAKPTWEMDSMPEGRGMVEGTLLADGIVAWVNGAQEGAQGYGVAQDPALEVLLYDPNQPKGKRFTTGPKSTIARLDNSVALLLLNGTLLISGSNPVEQVILQPTSKDPFVTEFRNEIYTPPYLQGEPTRPSAVQISSNALKADGSAFNIKFRAPANSKAVKVSLYYGGFVTNSVHMGHRMVFLDSRGFKSGSTVQNITVSMPPSRNIAPAGPYVIYVLVDGVPAMGQFVNVL